MSVNKKYNPIKLALSQLFLRHFKNDSDRKVMITPLKKAKSIGVTFVVANSKELDEIKKVIKQISNLGLEIIALGYIPDKKPSDFFLSEKAFNFFHDKELDWLLRPKSSSSIEFQNTNFDILIDLGTFDYYPMNYLLYKSKAKFKVGWFIDEPNVPFDFMMNMPRNGGHEYYMTQVLHYLDILN